MPEEAAATEEEPRAPEESAAADDDDSDDDSIRVDPPVHELSCRACSKTLTRRGMSVFLIADPAVGLYSTDIPTDGSSEFGSPLPIDTCECLIRRLHCSDCSSDVGYHVVTPCEECCLHEHNGHYWLFSAAAVHARARERESNDVSAAAPLTWSQLAYNGVEEGFESDEDETRQQNDEDEVEARSDAAGDAATDANICPICFCPIKQRTRLLVACEHEFCFGCISREVDARGRCPLDRLPLTRAMLSRTGGLAV